MERKPPQPLELFYCYAHEDRALRDELDKHLAGLRRSGAITTWHDGIISPGAVRKQAIETHLETAHIILLLISPDFLASDQCYSTAMTHALARHRTKQAAVIPILVRPVDVTATPFSSLHLLPSDARPVTLWPNADDAFVDIARGIRSVVDALLSPMHSPPTGGPPRFPQAHPAPLAPSPFPARLPTGPRMPQHGNRPPMGSPLPPYHATPNSKSKRKTWFLALMAVLLLFLVIMSTCVWLRPTNNDNLSHTSEQTSTLFPPTLTPTPSPTPVPPQPVTKNIHLACAEGCDHVHFDATLISYVVNQTMGSITFNYTISYKNTTICANEDTHVYLSDEQGKETWANAGSMFEELSFAPGQIMQQTAVIQLVPTSGVTYTLHTEVGCRYDTAQAKQAIPLTF